MKTSIAVLIGNGPSLLSVPDKFLEKWQDDTWGVNYIALHPWFRPAYYTCAELHILEQQLARDLAALASKDAIMAFINKEWCGRMARDYDLNNLIPIWRIPSGIAKTKFMEDPLKDGIATAAKTVTFLNMQLAWMLGYKTLLLVGMDHTYEGKPHFYDDKLAPKYKIRRGQKGEEWRATADYGYLLARNFYDNHGGKVVNLTQTELTTNIFEKGRIEDWM